MRKSLKLLSSVLAAVMIMMSLSAVVLADKVLVKYGKNDYFSWEYYSDGELEIFCNKNTTYYSLEYVDQKYVDSAKTIKINIDKLDLYANNTFDGNNCKASKITFIGAINFYIHKTWYFEDFPNLEGDDCIEFPSNFMFDGLSFYNIGFSNLKCLSDTVAHNRYFKKCNNLTEHYLSVSDQLVGYCENLESVEIGEYVETLPEFVFVNDKALSDVTFLGNKVTAIEYGAFMGCKSLTQIDLPDTVQSIGGRAFSETGIEMMSIPEGVPEIGFGTFGSCHDLEKVYLPTSIESIYYNAFEDCPSLTDVYYNGPRVSFNRITVKNEDGSSVTLREVFGNGVKIHCSDDVSLYSLSVGDVSNGTITLSKSIAGNGELIDVTATPAQGYELDKIYVNGTAIEGTTFTMPARDTVVTATFKKVTASTYTITVGSVTNGTVTVSKTSAQAGETITVTAKPNTGYALDTIKVNGTAISGNTFKMPAQNTTVTATFKKVAYSITVGSVTNGTVTVSKKTAYYGDTITVTAKPNSGYELEAIKVNGSVISGNTFKMPAKNTTVTATFKKKTTTTYTITVGSVTNGTVTVSKTSAQAGETITVTAKPNTGYALDTIKVNGTAISGNTFKMPAQNTTVTATFKKVAYTITVGSVTNGTVTVSKKTAYYGDTITVTAKPNSGYELVAIKVNGTAISGNTFKMPAQNTTVTATFKKIEITTGWVQDGDVWYYIKDDGTKATGWYKDGAWYYFDKNGVMQTGWQKIDGVWYYFRSSGSMYTGWLAWGSSWYYLKPSGAMATGWEKISGSWYLFNGSGVMLTGWQKSGNNWYYLESSGVMKTGWLLSGGKWYFLKDTGIMAIGWVSSGGYWYYMDNSGVMVTGWKTVDGYTYFLDPNTGRMVTGTVKINGVTYVFDGSGHCTNPPA